MLAPVLSYLVSLAIASSLHVESVIFFYFYFHPQLLNLVDGHKTLLAWLLSIISIKYLKSTVD